MKYYCWLIAWLFFFNFGQAGLPCDLQKPVKAIVAEKEVPGLLSLSTLLERCGEAEDSLALVYHTIGNIYSRTQLDSAVFYMERAVKLREGLYVEAPTLDLGKSNFNLGLFLFYQGLYKSARSYFERAQTIYTELGIYSRLRNTHIMLAQVATSLGRFALAESHLALVLSHAQSAGDDEGLRMAYLDLGLALLEQEKLIPARDTLLKAYKLYGTDISLNRTNCLQNLALTYEQLGQLPQAIAAYEQVVTWLEELDDCQNLGIVYNNLADAYVHQRQLVQANQLLQKGLAKAHSCKLGSVIAQAHDHWGEYHMAVGDLPAAIASFQQALKELIPDFQPIESTEGPTIEQLRYIPNQLDVLIYLGDHANSLVQAYEVRQNPVYLRAALEEYRTADALVDLIRQDHLDEATKLFWRKQVLPLYERAIAVCYQLNDSITAYHFFEKSKAILLLEALLEADAYAVLPDSLRQREQALSNELQMQDATISSVEAANKRLAASQALEELRKQLRRDYPAYQKLTQTVAIPDVSVLQRTCASAQQAIIHYFVGHEQCYALVIDKQGTRLHYVGTTAEVESSVRQVLDYFTTSNKIENTPLAYVQVAKACYQQLIAPIGIDEYESLVFIPDGLLTYLPFAALLREDVSTTDISQFPYLIRTHTLAYGHSVSTMVQQQRPEGRGAASIQAFAPFASGSAQVNYPPLNFSQDELESVATVIDTEVLQDEQATLASWQHYAVDARILHLSTHAFASRKDEQQAHIAFYDTLLFLNDVYRQQLSADLVVLSACQSNIGPLARGEGVLGLGRGFIQAGASSVVATLWNVNAAATGQVLRVFYQELLQGLSKPKALAMAQKQYLADTSIPSFQKSPYYWAGFTYYGDNSKVALIAKSSKLWWLYGSGMCLIAFVLGWMFWRRA